MNRKMILFAAAALLLVSLACTLNVTLPSTQMKTGPTVTEKINVPQPVTTGTATDLSLNFGAGDLSLSPGAGTQVISGTVSYNVADLKPVLTTDGSNVSLEQGNLKFNAIPLFDKNITNKWNLALGSVPMNLKIQAGAYKGNYELGGLALNQLEVTDGASEVHLNFSQPNLGTMSSLTYNTGASTVSLKGLGNASPTNLTFHSGAGSYTLEFSGQLSQDIHVTIDSGVSTVTIIVPDGVPVQLSNTGNLSSVTTSGGWSQSGNTYQLTGSGHSITIEVKMGAGTLQLQTMK